VFAEHLRGCPGNVKASLSEQIAMITEKSGLWISDKGNWPS
jgi:hypothetical protein